MRTKEIEVEIIQATKPDKCDKNGLITFRVLLPLYIWVETLTHRTFSRNASSARAMSNKRYIEMGFYMPKHFYKDQKGMQSSDEYIEDEEVARLLYMSAIENSIKVAEQLVALGITKEQANRIIPPIKMIQGIITGTEYSWRKFLELRNHPSADKAMQVFAQQIKKELNSVKWNKEIYHTPLCDGIEKNDLLRGVARLARVSYARSEKGKNDLELAETLLANFHLSPYEHIAFYIKNPPKSPINTWTGDLCDNYGWISFRTMIENGTLENWKNNNEFITK